MPFTPAQLLAELDALGITHETVSHAPVFTVEEAKAVRSDLPGSHLKNLFLRNKKGAMWLVVAREDCTIDLRSLAGLIDAGHLSFGSPERLMRHLGVAPGAVTPFAVVNDQAGAVRVVLDRSLLDASHVHAHPLANDRTTRIATSALMTLFAAHAHDPVVVDLAAPARPPDG